MAVAARAEQTTPSRWTAVSMALAPEETGVNLEDEMRKALAYQVVMPGVASEASESDPRPSLAEPIATAEIPVELESQVLATDAERELSQTSGAAEYAGAEPIRPAVQEFATMTASPRPDTAQAETEPAPLQTIDSANSSSLEAPPPVEAETTEVPVAAPVAEMEPPTGEAVAAPAQSEESRHDEPSPAPTELVAEQKSEEPPIPAPVASSDTQESPGIVEKLETAEPVALSQVPADHPPVGNASTPELAVSGETTHGGIPEMAKKESDIAATTAAAWASWRRIRETGDPKDEAHSTNQAEEKAAFPSDEAAMAVAAGAENAPEDVPAASESPEIASIVDSVLADLRPKIVEEITRKLRKKK
jgi:hypothetical protein